MNFPAQFRWILWGALCSAIVLYFVILQMNVVETEKQDTDFLKNLFYLLGLILFGAGQAIKYVANHTRTGKGEAKVPGWIDTGFIASLALTEAVAIFGLVLGFMGASPGEIAPLFVVSAIGMVLLTPVAFYKVETLAVSDRAG